MSGADANVNRKPVVICLTGPLTGTTWPKVAMRIPMRSLVMALARKSNFCLIFTCSENVAPRDTTRKHQESSGLDCEPARSTGSTQLLSSGVNQ